MNKRVQGFTLIEMLIVVAIIGILASIVIIGIGPAQARARDSRRASDLKQIQTSLELYYNQNNAYPTTGQDGPMTWANFTAAIVGANLGVAQLPSDPINSSTYFYQYGAAGDGTSYVLKATLEQVNASLSQSSLRGTIYGIDCGAAQNTPAADELKYCVGP